MLDLERPDCIYETVGSYGFKTLFNAVISTSVNLEQVARLQCGDTFCS